MVQKIFLVIYLSSTLVAAQADTASFSLPPVLKSALVPGWGQLTFREHQRASVYFLAEGLLVLATVGSREISRSKRRNYIAFAAEHAQVISDGKDHQYWVDIGNFASLDDYNAEHLRNRDTENLYPREGNWDWVWDKKQNRSTFERLRIQSDQWKQVGTFLIGGIVLNHCISAIDALYLKRKGTSFSLHPSYNPLNGSRELRLVVQF